MKNKVRGLGILIKKELANTVTFLNLVFGCSAIYYIFNEKYLLAAIFIIIASLLDRFDGKIARRLASSSEFGKELDSLADLVSFGIAPSLLIWMIALNLEWYGFILVTIYVLCGAYRLARFNTINNNNGVYIGVPITIAGFSMSVLSMLCLRYEINIYIIIVFILVISYCMVSKRIKITKR